LKKGDWMGGKEEQFTGTHCEIFADHEVDGKLTVSRFDMGRGLPKVSHRFMGAGATTHLYSQCPVCCERFEEGTQILTYVEANRLLDITPLAKDGEPIVVSTGAKMGHFEDFEKSLKCTCVECASFVPATNYIFLPVYLTKAEKKAAKSALYKRRRKLVAEAKKAKAGKR
jgi:hypothetical protein